MLQYIKSILWDWILCTAVSFGLVVHIYSGFELEDPYSQNMAVVLIATALITFILELFAYHKGSTIAGIIVGVALLVVFIIYVNSVNPFEDETANSVGIFLVATVITTLLCYLAARSRAGIIALFLAGNLVIAGSAFLQFPVQIWSLLLFLFAIAMLFFYRVYKISLLKVFTGKIRMMRFWVQTVCLCGVCFLLAAAVFGGIIRPLEPPTQELKLITKLEQMDLMQVLGISSVKKLLDPSMRSSMVSEDFLDANNPGEEENEDYGNEQEEQPPEEEQETDSNENVDKDNVQDALAVWYDMYQFKICWTAIIIIAAVVFLFVLRVLLHKRWRRQVETLDKESAVVNLYLFFYKRLQRCGYKKVPTHTLYEYAEVMEHEMTVLAVGESTFSRLTEIYVGVMYGRAAVSVEEYRFFTDFYNGFFKNLRKEIGSFRYLLKIFWI